MADVEEQFKTLALRGPRISCWMAIPVNCDVTHHSGMIWGREEFCVLSKCASVNRSDQTVGNNHMEEKYEHQGAGIWEGKSRGRAVQKGHWGTKR